VAVCRRRLRRRGVKGSCAKARVAPALGILRCPAAHAAFVARRRSESNNNKEKSEANASLVPGETPGETSACVTFQSAIQSPALFGTRRGVNGFRD
jgi:hypothetical protein